MTPHLAEVPVIRTARLILRAPQPGDWPVWRNFMLSDRSRFVRSTAMNEGTAWRGFASVIGHWPMRGFGLFVVTRAGSDAALGGVGPWYPAGWPEPEIGWSLWDAAAEGEGIAHEAVLAVRKHVHADLGWTRAVSYIDPINARSRALAQRLGCRIEPGAPTPGNEPIEVWVHPEPGAQA